MRLGITWLAMCGIALGQPSQAVNPTQQGVDQTSGTVPIFRVTVVARTTKAINYHHRSGSTMVGLRGTQLMPDAKGEAKVESKQGVIKIDANMSHLSPATQYGPEYLTYVMWAITPEGRATNIGEILLNGDKSKLASTSELQSFGLIVTAEPYFAVTQPSDVVVMENFIRQDTTGTIEELEAKFELLPRGQYTINANPRDLRPIPLDKRVPLELFEARNAVQIARWAGAAQYASDTFRKAEIGLQNAEGYLVGKGGKKPIGTVAREAVQMAEDARIITIKKKQEAALAQERADAATREARAESERAAAQQETERAKSDAEVARIAAQQSAQQAANEKAELERARAAALHQEQAARAQAQAAQAQAEEARVAAKAEADRAAAQLQAAQAQADAARLAAKAEADRAAREKAELEMAREAAVRQQESAKAETENAKRALAEADQLRQRAESEKEALRTQLLQQFNLILETRDSARGLIVNMSDVLFDTGQYSLRPGAREKLAKVAGIILGHPGLKMEVEGHTDSVGGDDFNQKLSEQRSGSVRNYLVQQGLPGNSITAMGFGETRPVATNDTAAGRQQNRRVELVVSGEILGNPLNPGSH